MKKEIDPYFEKVIDERFGRVYDRVDTLEEKLDSIISKMSDLQKNIIYLTEKASTNTNNIRILRIISYSLAVAIVAHTGEQLIIPFEKLLGI